MRSIPDPGFAGDEGAADPALLEALWAFESAVRAEAPDVEDRRLAALAVLQDARVLVPVVAVPGEAGQQPPAVGSDATTLTGEKTSDMASVLVTGRDGRTALLAFTGTAGLSGWNRSRRSHGHEPAGEARPVPVTARQAAQAALQDQAAALLLDLAGPVVFAVEAAELRALARGDRLVRVQGSWGWATSSGA